MPYGTIQADKIQGSINSFSPDSSFFRNRIINGAMVIDQRNAGASVSTDNSFPVDRFKVSISGSATATSQRSTVAPTGFINSALYTIGTGAAQGTSGVYRIFQVIEGFNSADLMWGTANAQTVTLSFWVRSSVTGTFSGGITEQNGGTASYTFTYSISAANTWEYKTVTIAGPTIGTWQTNNNPSIGVVFDLGSGTNFQQAAGSWVASGNKFRTSGSVVLSATSGATFYITGVQLEEGTTATSFDYRPYGTELALCQRYYFQNSVLTGISGFSFVAAATNEAMGTGKFSVTMRANPTVTTYNNAGTSGGANIYGVGDITGVTAGRITFDGFTSVVKTSGWSAGQIISGNIAASAEL